MGGGDLSVVSNCQRRKIFLKSHLIKSNHRVLRKNYTYTYGVSVFYLILMPLS
jgi:hypothetical protein